MQVGVVGIPALIVRVVVGTLCVAVGVTEVRRFQREVAVAVDAQDHPVRGAEATARENREGKNENGAGAKQHKKVFGT